MQNSIASSSTTNLNQSIMLLKFHVNELPSRPQVKFRHGILSSIAVYAGVSHRSRLVSANYEGIQNVDKKNPLFLSLVHFRFH